jgi:hypothetical protein
MAIGKVNTTYSKGIAENYKNHVNESEGSMKKKTKPMLEVKNEGVVNKGFKIDKKA